jgi:hypothetical protein
MARITQDDKDRFKEVFDTLIDDVGRIAKLHLEAKHAPCPSCLWDPVAKRSSGRYDASNPNPLGPLNIPFALGTRCPVCGGTGRLNEPRSVDVIGTISKNPEEFAVIAREQGRRPENIVKLRTKLDTLQAIMEAKSATIDGIIYDKLTHEIVQGLGDLQFVKTFWEQRSNTAH